MTPLPKTIRRNGFDFIQKLDAHPFYVYEKRKGSWIGYEVIKACQIGERIWKERTFSARWAYPSSEQWGLYGFSCHTLERARQKAFELVDSMEKAKA